MYSILIVGNQMDRLKEVASGMSRLGFNCTACIYVEDVITWDNRQTFNVVLLDISSTSPNGDTAWSWFRKVKLRRLLPIIALVSTTTLHLAIQEDAIEDFIVQPWNFDELAARIGKVIRRRNKPREDTTITVGDLKIDTIRCEVEISGRILALTFKEYELLKLLASNRGRVFTREELLNTLWGYDYFGGDRTVDVHIRRLRSKIEDPDHTFIETVRNIGYKLK
jgi:DNA-binding response OmpR family regulator